MIGRRKYKGLEKLLGYKFKDQDLLETALTHRSYRFENDDIYSDNQRLEFLGDAVLDMLTAEHLYERYPDDDEGVLTSFRSQVTSGKALADLGAVLELGSFLLMGRGEESSGGRKRSSNLADALESVFGAAFVDGGIKAVNKIFKKVFVPCIDRLSGDVWADNPKGKLQEYSQRRLKTSPLYHILSKEGPSHACSFTVEVVLSNGLKGMGVGVNKREAEVAAARDILSNILD